MDPVSWLNAYRRLQNLAFTPEEADRALDAARAGGAYETGTVFVRHIPATDQFEITDPLADGQPGTQGD